MTKEFKPGRPKFAHARARTRWARHELGETVVGLFAFYNNARSTLAVANSSMPCAVFDIWPSGSTRGKHRIRHRLGLEGVICIRVRPQAGEIREKLFHTWETVLHSISRRCWICVAYDRAESSTTIVSLQPPLSEDPMVFPPEYQCLLVFPLSWPA